MRTRRRRKPSIPRPPARPRRLLIRSRLLPPPPLSRPLLRSSRRKLPPSRITRPSLTSLRSTPPQQWRIRFNHRRTLLQSLISRRRRRLAHPLSVSMISPRSRPRDLRPASTCRSTCSLRPTSSSDRARGATTARYQVRRIPPLPSRRIRPLRALRPDRRPACDRHPACDRRRWLREPSFRGQPDSRPRWARRRPYAEEVSPVAAPAHRVRRRSVAALALRHLPLRPTQIGFRGALSQHQALGRRRRNLAMRQHDRPRSSVRRGREVGARSSGKTSSAISRWTRSS